MTAAEQAGVGQRSLLSTVRRMAGGRQMDSSPASTLVLTAFVLALMAVDWLLPLLHLPVRVRQMRYAAVPRPERLRLHLHFWCVI